MLGLHVPWPTRFVIPDAKIERYLLDPSSADGAAKARYLTSYGFDRADPEILADALRRHACPMHFAGVRVVGAGLKYLFDGPVPAPNGGEASLFAVWLCDYAASETARFVTARPSRRPARGP